MSIFDTSSIRGFNYAPSYASCGLEIWQQYDPDLISRELSISKGHFPSMNAIRLWLDWEAFKRDEGRFRDNFEHALTTATKLGVSVMPVLFNRWHSTSLDFGGVYVDHFLPGHRSPFNDDAYDRYLRDIAGAHRDDERILAWDLCNEPFFYNDPSVMVSEVIEAELRWLTDLAERLRSLGVRAPITIGIHPMHGKAGLEQVEPICDVLSIHPYYNPFASPNEVAVPVTVEGFVALLDDYVAVSEASGKPLIASECCLGSLDDSERVRVIEATLRHLSDRGIGWLIHLLYHSRVADGHRPEHGPIGPPGYMAFVELDGSVRPGHEIFNDF